MITAYTVNRIRIVYDLYEIKPNMETLTHSPCIERAESKDIEEMVNKIDNMINRIMSAK